MQKKYLARKVLRDKDSLKVEKTQVPEGVTLISASKQANVLRKKFAAKKKIRHSFGGGK